MSSTYFSRRSRLGRRSSAALSSRLKEQKMLQLNLHTASLSRRHSSASIPHPETGVSSEESDATYIKLEEDVDRPPQTSLSSPPRSRSPSVKDEPLTYASLPPTPVSLSRPHSPSPEESKVLSSEQQNTKRSPFSVWDYLREELLATDFDSHQDLKWERVSNFLNIPIALEKTLSFGFILCFDAFLHTFTILPIRFLLAVYSLLKRNLGGKSSRLPSSQKADILKTLLLVISILMLTPLTDASKIYHSIRGQDTIKLYVIFNALEIADRLCTSFGQDILDCLFARTTMSSLTFRDPINVNTLRPLMFFFIATTYTVAHALVLIYQMTALNVAINSYDHALLTLLLSNQFVEIKGSVFKKFEKDNLFQITCADIVERFSLSLMLISIALRNMIELSGSIYDQSEGIVLPKSFGWFRGSSIIWTIFNPVLTVLGTELFVDWLKHAFITKFNHLRPSVYERFMDVLCLDLAAVNDSERSSARKHTYVDQAPVVTRRLGFPVLPLTVLSILMVWQSMHLVFADTIPIADLPSFLVSNAKWLVLLILVWLCFVVIKVIIGINILTYATRRRVGMKRREEEDRVNDFGRDPIGEGKDEQTYNKGLRLMLDNKMDNAAYTSEIGERRPDLSSEGPGDPKRKKPKLEELTRFTMVKRIW